MEALCAGRFCAASRVNKTWEVLTVSGVMVWSRRGSHGINEELEFRLFAASSCFGVTSRGLMVLGVQNSQWKPRVTQTWCETKKKNNQTHRSQPREGCESQLNQQINSIKWKKNQTKPPNQTKETFWWQPRLLKITSSQTFISKVVVHVKWKYLSKPYVHTCVVQTATTVQQQLL